MRFRSNYILKMLSLKNFISFYYKEKSITYLFHTFNWKHKVEIFLVIKLERNSNNLLLY